jgi:hypothetical protein
MNKKYHFIYKTINPKNGKYYIGKHSTNNLNDGYQGSGKWVEDCLKSKTKLITKIIRFCKNEEESYLLEEIVVKRNLNNTLNKNFKQGGKGNKSEDVIGNKNPFWNKKHKSKTLFYMSQIKKENKFALGHKKTVQVLKYLSKIKLGKLNPMYGKKKSKETLKKMSQARKLFWQNKRIINE